MSGNNPATIPIQAIPPELRAEALAQRDGHTVESDRQVALRLQAELHDMKEQNANLRMRAEYKQEETEEERNAAMTELAAKLKPGTLKPTPDIVDAEHENKGNIELILAHDDTYMNLVNDEQKDIVKAAIAFITDLNGKGYTPGQAASYIAESQYVQEFEVPEASPEMKKSLFLAYNWIALGRGTSGIAGAAIRYALRSHFTPGREHNVHRVMPEGFADQILAYNTALRRDPEIHKFFLANALSVAALAGAMMNRIDHHWDANNTRSQVAMLSAMGMADKIDKTKEALRPIFYLSIHPLPLTYTERLREAAAKGLMPEVAEVVRLRCLGPPAGFGAFNACAAAVPGLLAEPFMNHTGLVDMPILVVPPNASDEQLLSIERHNRRAANNNKLNFAKRARLPILRMQFAEIYDANKDLIDNASKYHIRAKAFGHAAKKPFDTMKYTELMIILAAYIYAKVKGTLAESAALRKFRNEHSRKISQGIAALDQVISGESIEDFLGLL